MKRHILEKRPNFEQSLLGIGMNYWDYPSGPLKLPYWQEGVTYGFSETEIDKIQEATQEAHDISIEMVSSMVNSGDYPEYFALDDTCKNLIEQSWKRGDKSLYGRFDFVYNDNAIKMLEYNGDTPVSILECSVAQWDYIQDIKKFPLETRIQYNLIDETLIETWNRYFEKGSTIHFASSGGFRHEDYGNMVYIMDTALRAGMNVKDVQMEDIALAVREAFGDLPEEKLFVDLETNEIKNIFKLYPWEWMVEEEYGKEVANTNTTWYEPAWKMLLSNKAMLVKLWEMFPNHPYLLESYAEKDKFKLSGKFARKAIHGREGSNIYQTNFLRDGIVLSDQLGQGSHKVPEYDKWGYMYQRWIDLPVFDGYRPIIGSWVIGDKACGMSIREDKNLITGNDAFFASHFFVPEADERNHSNLF